MISVCADLEPTKQSFAQDVQVKTRPTNTLNGRVVEEEDEGADCAQSGGSARGQQTGFRASSRTHPWSSDSRRRP